MWGYRETMKPPNYTGFNAPTLLMTGTTCMVVQKLGGTSLQNKVNAHKYCFTFPVVGTGITKASQSFYYSNKK